jgi:hypothetical protein
VPLDLYIMYKNTLRHDFEVGATNITDYAIYTDPFIQKIITQVLVVMGDNDINWYSMFRNLVDQIVYDSDQFTGYDEYPKYPLETIVDGSGDCEDSAILLASLLRGFKYRWQTNLQDSTNPIKHALDGVNVALLVMPTHVAVGYWTPDFEAIFDPQNTEYDSFNVVYYKDKDNNKYCYVESTSNDFIVCELPEQLSEIARHTSIFPLK